MGFLEMLRLLGIGNGGEQSQEAQGNHMIENLAEAIRQAESDKTKFEIKTATLARSCDSAKRKVENAEANRRRLESILQEAIWVALPQHVDGEYSVVGPIDWMIHITEHQVESWRFGEELGSGSHGLVREVTNIKTGAKLAMKIIDKNKICNEHGLRNVAAEISALRALKGSANVIQLEDILHAPKSIFIITELAEQALNNYMYFFDPSDNELSHIAFGILTGLISIHEKGFCHGDIKPENIVICNWRIGTSLTYKNIKIIDFGLSSKVDSKGSPIFKQTKGTIGFRPPEALIRNSVYDGFKADTWALGVTLMELIWCPDDFEKYWIDGFYGNLNNNDIALNKFEYSRQRLPKNEKGDFIQKALCINPSERRRPNELIKHIWMRPIRKIAQKSRGEYPSSLAYSQNVE